MTDSLIISESLLNYQYDSSAKNFKSKKSAFTLKLVTLLKTKSQMWVTYLTFDKLE